MSEGAVGPEDREAQVQRVTQTLKREDRSGASEEVIERTVRDCFAERDGAEIQDFVSLLAERSAKERLRRLPAESP